MNARCCMQVAEVVAKSRDYLDETFPSERENLRLEGVELSDDESFWFVTFSYFPEKDLLTPREYRTVKVRATDGQFFGARNGVLPMGLM